MRRYDEGAMHVLINYYTFKLSCYKLNIITYTQYGLVSRDSILVMLTNYDLLTTGVVWAGKGGCVTSAYRTLDVFTGDAATGGSATALKGGEVPSAIKVNFNSMLEAQNYVDWL